MLCLRGRRGIVRTRSARADRREFPCTSCHHTMLLLLVALLGSLHPALAIKQVAIVGGGVSGAASAHFLRSTLGADVNITM